MKSPSVLDLPITGLGISRVWSRVDRIVDVVKPNCNLRNKA